MLVNDVVLAGVLRLLTTAAVVGKSPLDPKTAWEVSRTFCERSDVQRISLAPNLDVEWKRLLDGCVPAARADTDLYLLAFAKALDVPFVTFDEALARRFSDADILVPEYAS